jgi:hypothetical protein
VQKVSLRVMFFVCALLGAFAFQAFASKATVAGTPPDPSGAAVPNSAVTTVNTETNHVGRLATNSEGQYLAPRLRIGNYAVRVEAAGFKKAEQKDRVLTVGNHTRVDFKLEIGTGQESVTVGAAPAAVQTETGKVAGTIAGSQVKQLAVNGRSIYGLTALTSGASNNSHQRRLHA